LAAITAFYLLVGLLFLWGLVNLVEVASAFLSSTTGQVLRLVIGAGMLVGSFFIGGKKDGPAPVVPAPPGRLTRWRNRLLDPATPPIAVIGLAIAAGLIEVATMLPYIVAMTMLADAGLGTPMRVAALAGYCLVMIVPALMLLVLRIVARRAAERPLRRIAAWLSKDGAETTAWIVGIVGFFVARAAASELGIFGNFLGG
ncbi:MAG: GAP family protein, partial [Microbacterium sp.]